MLSLHGRRVVVPHVKAMPLLRFCLTLVHSSIEVALTDPSEFAELGYN